MSHEDAQHRRELEHAKWRVSFVEFLLATHRNLTMKDEEWKREEAKLVERVAAAKKQLDQISEAGPTAAAK